VNTNRFFDLSEKSDALYDAIDSQDKQEWKENPCTKWLLEALNLDLNQMFIVWYNNGFSKEDSACTDEMAKGRASAIDDLLEKIQEMLSDEDGNSDV
jgi:hypothetical protein